MSERAETGADDLPYVDGSKATPEELRAEVAAEVAKSNDPEVQQIEEVREELAATVDELRSRLDVRRQVSEGLQAARPAVIAAAALLAAVVVWRLVATRRRGD
jgi:hypothetical protein